MKTHKREKFGLTRCGKAWSPLPGKKKVAKSTGSWIGTTCNACLWNGMLTCGQDSGLRS